MANKILVLDAGHGLSTAGKQTINGSRGVVKEWTMNDAVVRKITSILSAYNVTIHRTDDPSGKTDVALLERVKRCNGYKPDLFISIHHNAGGGTGTEVYWHTKGTAEDKKVAGIVAPKLASQTGMKNRGVKTAEFTVLTCNATAILVEGGFMDTVADYEIITSDGGQQKYAQAVADSVIEYLGLTKVVNSQPTVSQPSTNTSASSDSFLVEVICNELNVRKEASFDSAIVGVVKKGEVYTIVEEKNGLGRLKSGTGWVSMGEAYVKRKNSAPTSATVNTDFLVKIICNELNIRQSDNFDSKVVGTVKKNEVYTITQESNGLGKLKSGAGWISMGSAYVQKV